MNKKNQLHDDEIDLFKLFQMLWDGKWFITAFTVTAILAGSGFIFVKDSVYESKLVYSIDTIPPFYEDDDVFADFQNLFYSISIFEEWKKSIGNTSLIFEDFSNTEVFDGVVVSKSEDFQLATLAKAMTGQMKIKKGSTFILVKTNQLAILDDFFKYANHINMMMKNEYFVMAKDELKNIESRSKSFSSANNNIFKILLSIDRFVASIEKGANPLKILNPTMPTKISPLSLQILLLSGLLGWMIGVFFIFIRNAIKKRKEQLAKV